MNNTISLNDRVLISNSGLNPLTDFYMVEELQNYYKCKFNFGIFSGFQDFPKYQVTKHPIQSSQFKLEVSIRAKEAPSTNDFDRYFATYNNLDLLFRMSIVCFMEILNNFTYQEHLETAKEILQECLISSNSVEEIDKWITGTVDNLPSEFDSRAVIEYTGTDQAIAIFTSEHPNNDNTTLIFLLCFTAIILDLNLVSPEILLKRTKNFKLNLKR